MATAPLCDVEEEVLRGGLAAIGGVACAFAEYRKNTLFCTVVMREKDYEVEDRIYELQLALVDRFPEMRFDFNIVVRAARKLSEVVTPVGHLILGEGA